MDATSWSEEYIYPSTQSNQHYGEHAQNRNHSKVSASRVTWTPNGEEYAVILESWFQNHLKQPEIQNNAIDWFHNINSYFLKLSSSGLKFQIIKWRLRIPVVPVLNKHLV